MSEKLTPWFPADVKPARVGVYEKDFQIDEGHRSFQYWSGRRWWYGTGNPEGTKKAFLSAPHGECRPRPRPWRGLASDPGAAS
jgi:hypothetical protein